jgi:hypothetical protein
MVYADNPDVRLQTEVRSMTKGPQLKGLAGNLGG